MPRNRAYRSPSNEREVHHKRHRKHHSRSSSPPENHRKSRHKHKHKERSRSRSESWERESHTHKETERHKRHKHHHHEENEYDPHKRIKQERTDDISQQRQDRRQNDERRKRARQQRAEEGVDMNFGRPEQNAQNPNSQGPPPDKDKPDFKLSGKLTEDTNTFRGVVVNYNEPPEARKPKKKWRLYPFKGDNELPVLHIHRQSAYLVGRDRRVADIPVDHPSCSKQHAALQFRLTEFKREDGTRGRKVKPYVIDLNSANGTYVNNNKIEGQRYLELFEKDVIKFGYSSREYVILHDKVDTSELLDEGDD